MFTQCSYHSSSLQSFVQIQVSMWQHFPSSCRAYFNISCNVGVLVKTSFSFCILTFFYFLVPKKSLFCFYFKKIFLLEKEVRLTLIPSPTPHTLSSLVVCSTVLFMGSLKRNLLFLFSFSMHSLFSSGCFFRFSLQL